MRNIYILKLMCFPRIPKIKQLQIWMKLGVNMGYAGISILRTIDQMASEICGVQNGLKLL